MKEFDYITPAICKVLKRLSISPKKTLKHPRACPIKKLKCDTKLQKYQKTGYPIIYMDGNGFEPKTVHPFGYAPIGTPYTV